MGCRLSQRSALPFPACALGRTVARAGNGSASRMRQHAKPRILGSEPLSERESRGIRIAVERILGVHRRDDAGKRVERVFITGEFERVGCGRFALPVGRKGKNLGAQADYGLV